MPSSRPILVVCGVLACVLIGLELDVYLLAFDRHRASVDCRLCRSETVKRDNDLARLRSPARTDLAELLHCCDDVVLLKRRLRSDNDRRAELGRIPLRARRPERE
jgi:hypothetical protein